MNFTDSNTAMASYQQADLYGGIESADPHRLIEMLLDGALKNLANVRLAIDAGDTAKKCMNIEKVLNILDALRNSLDLDSGGNIASNLDDLYDYMQRSLIKSNFDSSAEIVLEVSNLLTEIKSAWSQLSYSEL